MSGLPPKADIYSLTLIFESALPINHADPASIVTPSQIRQAGTEFVGTRDNSFKQGEP